MHTNVKSHKRKIAIALCTLACYNFINCIDEMRLVEKSRDEKRQVTTRSYVTRNLFLVFLLFNGNFVTGQFYN